MCLEVSYRNIRITERWKTNRSDACAFEVSYRNIRITERWKRNRSVVCAWKYHTEILELQRDGREIEVLYVLGSIIQKY